MDTETDPSPMLWTCNTCEETFNIFTRDSHLISLQHVRKLRALNTAAASDHTPDGPPVVSWTCEICDVAMNLFAREDHLLGIEHRRALRKRELGSGSSIGAASTIPAGTCTNDIYADPSMEVRALVQRLAELQQDEVSFTCHICMQDTTLAALWIHVSPAWSCDVCGIRMHIEAKEEHREQHNHTKTSAGSTLALLERLALLDGGDNHAQVESDEDGILGDEGGIEDDDNEVGEDHRGSSAIKHENVSTVLLGGYEPQLVGYTGPFLHPETDQSTDLISLRERNGDRRYDIAEDTLDTEQQAGADREAVDALTDTSTSNHQKIDSEDNRGLPAYDMFEDHLERNPWQDEPVQKQHLLSEIIAVEATPDDPSSVDNDNTLPNGDVEPIADNTTDTAEQPPVTENDKVMAETSRMGDSATDEHPEGHLPLLDLVDLEPAANSPSPYATLDAFLNQFEADNVQSPLWECRECARTMPLGNREGHLTGKMHIRRVALETRFKNSQGESLIDVEESGDLEGAESWERGGKGGESGNSTCIWPGVSEDRGRESERVEGPVDLLTEIDLQIPSVERHAEQETLSIVGSGSVASSIQSNLSNWVCTKCNCTVNLAFKDNHLNSPQHQQQTAKLPADETPPPGSATYAPSTWTCLLCNMTMQRRQQTEHLSGQKHIRRVELDGGVALIQPAATVQSPDTPWTCTTCQRTMPILSKEPHLAGRKHREMLGESMSQASSVRETATIPRWTCEPCGITMHLWARKTHLQGLKHQSTLENDGSAVDASGNWTCRVCNLIMIRISKQAHLQGMKHIEMVKLQDGLDAAEASDPGSKIHTSTESPSWTCTLCALPMHPSSRSAHLAGVRHRTALITKPSTVEPPAPQNATPPSFTPGPNDETYQCVACKLPHPVWILQQPGTQIWTCELCQTSMHLVSRDAHLASAGHRRREMVLAAKGQVIGEVPKGPRTWVKGQEQL